MTIKPFDTSKSDAQATVVEPITPERFDLLKYRDYEEELLEKCGSFWKTDTGVLVYRRMRVADVFSYGCRDMKQSLEWQLGALEMSMQYKADVPNFLEPWYGIGTAASAFGAETVWEEGQAPMVRPKFQTLDEALQYSAIPVEETSVGMHTLSMAEYFLERTCGKMPMSFCDVQSPLNAVCQIIDTGNILTDMIMNPEEVRRILDRVADLVIRFAQKQKSIIRDSLVCPGHGFASSRAFEGLGVSDDNAVMLSSDLYQELVGPTMEKISDASGGIAFHSCGDWSNKIHAVRPIRGLKMVDGAFSQETDPMPNPPEPFAGGFGSTGIAVNARMVGDLQTIRETVKKLWNPPMKLIVVTYCPTPGEQKKAYDLIHSICS